MTLTPSQRERLSQALLAAFPRYTSLAEMLSFKMDVNLERISRADSLDVVVSKLISWVEEDVAQLKGLLRGAVATVPRDPELRALAEEILKQEEGQDDDAFIPPLIEEEQPLTTRELLFRGHPVLGRFFTLRPPAMAGAVLLTALVLLIGTAAVLKVLSVPCPDGRNFGILGKPNWLYIYPGLLPILFSWASLTNENLRHGLHRIYWRLRVIKIRHDVHGKNYLQALSEYLEARRRTLLAVVIVVTVAFMAFDTYDLWLGYLRPPFAQSVKPDWDTAFTKFEKSYYADETFFKASPCTPTSYPSRGGNLAFDVIAYGFQGAAIFLALFWILKFSLALYSLSGLLKQSKSDYQLDLMEFDPDRRLGLGPLGKAYNGFLVITVAYQIFVFLHRLQIIAQWDSAPTAWKYISLVAVGLFNPTIWSNPKFYGYVGLGDWGARISLTMMFVPVVVICYFPLWKLRKRVNEIKEQKRDKYSVLYDTAKKRGNDEDAQDYLKKMTALDKANIWPNGNVTAWWFLMCMLVLLIAGWFPPLLPPLLLIGVVVVLILTFRNKLNEMIPPAH